MTNLANLPPLGLKQPQTDADPEYIADVRSLPCCICEAFGEVQRSPTTAHHCIHGRFSTRRAPDRAAIPLCDGHHQGDFDKSKFAIHRGKKSWAARYGHDHEWISPTQDKIERLRNGI